MNYGVQQAYSCQSNDLYSAMMGQAGLGAGEYGGSLQNAAAQQAAVNLPYNSYIEQLRYQNPDTLTTKQIEDIFSKIGGITGTIELKDKKGKNKTMLKEFKQYIVEHKDLIFGAVLLAIADKVFLEGALQTKIAALAHRTLDGLEKKAIGGATEAK